MRPLVYIAHPLGGAWEPNIASARVYAERLAREGFAPVAPYLTLYGLLHEPDDREIGLSIDEAAIARADALLVCGATISPGMQQDIAVAKRWDIPVVLAATPDAIDAAMLEAITVAMALKIRRRG